MMQLGKGVAGAGLFASGSLKVKNLHLYRKLRSQHEALREEQTQS